MLLFCSAGPADTWGNGIQLLTDWQLRWNFLVDFFRFSPIHQSYQTTWWNGSCLHDQWSIMLSYMFHQLLGTNPGQCYVTHIFEQKIARCYIIHSQYRTARFTVSKQAQLWNCHMTKSSMTPFVGVSAWIAKIKVVQRIAAYCVQFSWVLIVWKTAHTICLTTWCAQLHSIWMTPTPNLWHNLQLDSENMLLPCWLII